MLTDTKEGEIERLLREGQDAAKRGDIAVARAALSQVVEHDPDNEVAWMWLSGVVDDVAEQQICLENVLVINPDNTNARKGLDYLQGLAVTSQPEPQAPSYAADYASNSNEAAVTEGDFPAPDQYASVVAHDDQVAENTDPGFDTPEFNLEASGLELQTSPTLEGSFPWLQSLEQQNNSTGSSQNGSGFEPAAAFPFDATVAFGDPPPDAAGPSPLHETSFAGVADEPFMGSARSDVAPFNPEQEELPMFDFSSFTESVGATPASSQTGGDASVDFGNPHFNFEDHVAAQSSAGSSSNSGFTPLPQGGFTEMMNGPVGPMSEVNLPAPSELPGYKGEAQDWSQPWYVESAEGPPPIKIDEPSGVPSYSSSYTSDQVALDPSAAKKTSVATMKCPNCREDVADTALACPNCRFNFFINCPNCHELVDASDAAPGKSEKCPHCSAAIDLITLGQSGVDGAAQYQSTKLAVGANSLLATSFEVSSGPRKRVGFGWVVDIVWLITIIAIVWALTQLPTWLHLTGQY